MFFYRSKCSEQRKKELLLSLFNALPKTELHAHFSATIPLKTIRSVNGEDFQIIEKKFKSLDDFNKYYAEVFNKVVWSSEFLETAMYDICMECAQQNIHHLEIRQRFPQRGNLSNDEVLEAVHRAIHRAVIDLKNEKFDFSAGFIVSIAKDDEENHRNNQGTVESVIKSLHEYMKKYEKESILVGIDILGDEDKSYLDIYPYSTWFAFAKTVNLGITIHAGEVHRKKEFNPVESIKYAVYNGTNRIGHGLHLMNDEELVKKVVKDEIGIELCPTSNVKLKNISSYKKLPVKKMLDEDVLVSINTDDKLILNTDCSKEYWHLVKSGVITKWSDIKKLALNGIKMAFVSKKRKEKLFKIYDEEIDKIEHDPVYKTIIREYL